MAIRTFNSVGGFSVGEVPVQVIDNTGNIANVGNAVIGNITALNLTNTYVTFTDNDQLSDSANFTFTNGNLLTIIDSANITDGNNFVTITGANGGITTNGDLSVGNGAFTVNTDGDAVFSNSLIVGTNAEGGGAANSAFYVDAAGNFSIKVANATSGGFDTVFSVDAASGDITTAGSVVSPGGGAATISAPGANTQILFNDASNVGASSLFTFDKDAQSLTIDGNINLLETTGNGHVVLPKGGYLYDGGITSSAILHAEGSAGTAQLEWGTASYVYASNTGVHLESNVGNANIHILDNGNVAINAGSSNVTLAPSGNIAISAGTSNVKVATSGNIGVNAGNAAISAVYNANVTISAGSKAWDFKTDGNLSAPGSIYANAGDIYANTGLINANTLNIIDSANIHGATRIDGTFTVNAASNLLGVVTVGNTALGGTTANLDVSGNLHVYKDANIDGALTIGNLHVTHYVTSDLVPDQDEAYDLGKNGHRWKDLWLSGFTINLGSTTISSGGSNNMIVGNAIIGYGGALANYTSPTVGNLYAGYFTTSNNVVIGNSTARANLAVSGNLTIDDATDAANTTSGSFQVKGGVGIGGKIYVGGNANIAGNVLIEGANVDISNGNLHVSANANIHGSLLVGGDLTVSGTTTYVNTTNSSIKDALIEIGGDGAGGAPAGPDAADRGLYIRNVGSSQFMGWKQADSEFQLLSGVTETNNVVTGVLANLSVDHLFGTIGTDTQDEIKYMGGLTNIDISGFANVTGTANIDTAILADLTLGELHFTNLDVAAPLDNEVVVLKTDGAGNVEFQIIHTDRISNTLSGSQIYVDGVDDNGNITFTVNGTSTPLVVTELGANVTGDLYVTGELNAGTLTVGSLTPQSISLGNTTIVPFTTELTGDAMSTIAEVPAEIGTAVEFFVKGKATTSGGVDVLTVATVTAMYDGDHVDFATYGKLHMGGDYGAGELTVIWDGGNIQLQATPTQSGSIVTVWTAQVRTI